MFPLSFIHHLSLSTHHFPVFPFGLYFALMAFVFGACIGSFLNVCIYRIPRDLSVVKPRSFCPHCSKPIPWFHNIPLVSWLALGGKSRCCSQRISPRYFLVELLTAVLFFLVWCKYYPPDHLAFLRSELCLRVAHAVRLDLIGDWRLIPVYWLILFGLVLGTFVDFEHLIIPDRVTIGGIIAGLVLSPLLPTLHGTESVLGSLKSAGMGAGLGFGILWSIAKVGKLIFKKDAMGFGDVKLIAGIGAFFGWRAILFNVVVSSFLGSLVGITLVAVKRRGLQSRIPYGPYIAAATVIWLLWGKLIWSAYMGLLFPPPLI